MRRIEQLILESRSQTENSDVSTTIGIQDEEFIRYYNNAQDRLQSLVYNVCPRTFLTVKEIQCVANQEAYTLPTNLYLNGKIETVEYSQSGTARDYYPLKQGNTKDRISEVYGEPYRYIRIGSTIYMAPVPQSSASKIRITFAKKVQRLDIKRGSVASATTSGTSLTALTLNTSSDTVDSTLSDDSYLCIVDALTGMIKMKDVAFTAVDTTTGVVTINGGSHTFETGESVSVGDLVCRGKNAGTISELPDDLERYLIEFCNWKISRRDANIQEIGNISQEIVAMEQEIIAAYASISDDQEDFPVTDDVYLLDQAEFLG